jgi:hypothetical protein
MLDFLDTPVSLTDHAGKPDRSHVYAVPCLRKSPSIWRSLPVFSS